METLVRWTGPGTMSFVAETGSGHAVVMDGAPEGGGRDLGPRPMEMVLLGTGAAQRFPHPRLTAALTARRIGVEAMDTGAACRTYNILMAEGRKVLAALLPA